MPKKVKLNIEIDEKGNIVTTADGTEGHECVDLMDFLARIPGFTLVESKPLLELREIKTKKINKNLL